jgi:agmatine deiminase
LKEAGLALPTASMTAWAFSRICAGVNERLPMPTPMFLTAEEAGGLDRTNPRLSATAGDRLAASYVNFLIVNDAVIAPAFGVPTDAGAEAILTRLGPAQAIVMLPSREILLGGGNIHCVTQQQPWPRGA